MCIWKCGCVVIYHPSREELRTMGDEAQWTRTKMVTWKWREVTDWMTKEWNEVKWRDGC